VLSRRVPQLPDLVALTPQMQGSTPNLWSPVSDHRGALTP
jgi:hypothetical protein